MATLEGARKKYERAMEIAHRNRNYVKGMAEFFGVPPSTIEGSDPVKAWDDKFADAKARADRAQNWMDKLKAAFGL